MAGEKLAEALAKRRQLRLVDDPAVVLGEGHSVKLDGWTNDVTGFGTSRDKTSYNRFVGDRFLQEEELSELYHAHDLAARMVDVVPDEMLREGFDVQLGDSNLDLQMADKIAALGLNQKLANGIRWGRLFGMGGLLLGCDDGRSASTPLAPEKARAFSYVYEFDRRYVWPLTWYRDNGNPKLGQPETYMVTSPSAYTDMPTAVVHESRMLTFGGATTAIQEKQINFGWDLSILQRPHKVLGDFDMGWNSVAVLLQDANQGVFTLQGVSAAIASGNSEALFERYKEIDKARSILRALVVDAGTNEAGGADAPEGFTRQQFTFTGIPDVLDKLMLRLAAAVQIPVTILMGQSPAGMNATGESDFRWFYDRIKSEQTRKLAPVLRRLVRVILATKEFANPAPKTLTFKFPQLWSEPPLTAAQTRQALITGDTLLTINQIALPEEVAEQRLQPGGYDRELVLTPEGLKVRQAVIKGEYLTLTPDQSKENDVPDIKLAPTDAATVIKVNEARASLKLPPLEGPDGDLTLSEFAAKNAPASPGGFGDGGGAPAFGKKPALPGTPAPELKPEPEPTPTP
jgi:uncharacterized protein